MRSLRGHLVKNNVLMIFVSLGLVLIMSSFLVLLFSIGEPDGFGKLIRTLSEIGSGQGSGPGRLVYYFMLWALFTGLLVIVTCIGLSSRFARRIIAPVNTLREDAERIANGELDFEVLVPDAGTELTELGNSIEDIRKKLREQALRDLNTSEERKMLVANLSHDMRTPVTAIKGYMEGLRDGIADTPEKREQYMNTIYSKTLVLEKLVDGLTEYSELELGRMQYTFAYIDIFEFLRGMCEEYSYEVQLAGISFEGRVAAGSLTVMADRAKLTRVLDNLIGNAVKYNKDGGSITMTAMRGEKGVLITVTDTGVGISAGDLPKVFDGFYRGDQSRSNIRGNGLGMAIAKQIVEDHHGKIWVRSARDVGTEVSVYLPERKTQQ